MSYNSCEMYNPFKDHNPLKDPTFFENPILLEKQELVAVNVTVQLPLKELTYLSVLVLVTFIFLTVWFSAFVNLSIHAAQLIMQPPASAPGAHDTDNAVELEALREQVEQVIRNMNTIDTALETMRMHHGNNPLERRLTALLERFETLEGGLTRLQGRFETLEGGLDGLQGHFETLEEGLTGMQRHFETMEGGLNELQGQLYTLEEWLNALQRQFHTLDGLFNGLERDMRNLPRFSQKDADTLKWLVAQVTTLRPHVIAARRAVGTIQAAIRAMQEMSLQHQVRHHFAIDSGF
ncbi:hypothetical protein BDB00DRAFT_875387 [Zychaea mexicana]|uniref:uncharacterized protein n=1 Tax=Zychaea mexicana TaxID=64656 RepID=UPI0022FE4521|nr:uncharacterized protein BDB00DRAFT_875387 [Zychaea mexicana]KAI9490331.1 hypothetical protein BDB00DRAFT_875387 [Zychaea mexicana]